MKTARKQPSKIHKKRKELCLPLIETLTTVGVVGILSSIAVPAYIDQKERGCQAYPESVIATALTHSQAFKDEFGTHAEGWKDLDKIATIMTSTGPANENNFNWISLPSCNYSLMGAQAGNEYTFTATQQLAFIKPQEQVDGNEIDQSKNKYNVVGCINTETGASDIRRGDGDTAVNTSALNCS